MSKSRLEETLKEDLKFYNTQLRYYFKRKRETQKLLRELIDLKVKSYQLDQLNGSHS